MVDSNSELLPAFRQRFEVIRSTDQGQPILLLKDLEGLNPHTYALSPAALYLASLFTGQRTAGQILAAFEEETGERLGPDVFEKVVHQFIEAKLLETPEVTSLRNKRWKGFDQSALRAMTHQMGGYPGEPEALRARLNDFVLDPKGPQKEFRRENAAGVPPLALVSPHIDFHRGGPAYAWAYQTLSECAPPDVIVALGVAHQSPPSPWAFTSKAYETPCGTLPVDQSLSKAMGSLLSYDPEMDQRVHRDEHSLEFQAVWLKALWGERCPPWVPILCSHLGPDSEHRSPSKAPAIEDAIVRIGGLLAERQAKGQRILVLAGIDLAHVGPRFGDGLTLGRPLEERVEKEDRLSLEKALTLDAEGFYSSVIADGHWRKVCGLSALYCILRWTKMLAGETPTKGRLLTYGQAPDPLGGLVSFTSLLFPRP